MGFEREMAGLLNDLSGNDSVANMKGSLIISTQLKPAFAG